MTDADREYVDSVETAARDDLVLLPPYTLRLVALVRRLAGENTELERLNVEAITMNADLIRENGDLRAERDAAVAGVKELESEIKRIRDEQWHDGVERDLLS